MQSTNHSTAAIETSSLTATNGSSKRKQYYRRPTYPLIHSSRKKPRRWPLVLRFIKGAVHGAILLPVIFHILFTVAIVLLNFALPDGIGLPATIIPSLSIVVGLMLVFRNQTSYNRFWDGRNNLTVVVTGVRNLTRTILACSSNKDSKLTPTEKADIEQTVRILMAVPYALKNHLRAEWGAAWAPTPGRDILENPDVLVPRLNDEYSELLPGAIQGHEDEGLGLPLQLFTFIEGFVKRGFNRGWFHAPQASQLQAQLNTMTDAYGKMETIRMTPMPVAHLIHQKQVLALYCCVLPFAMVDNVKWWTVPIVALVTFTLYGIEGIGSQLEDPFGYDRNDIKMDAIAEDSRIEISVMLDEWKRVVAQDPEGDMFMERPSMTVRVEG